MVSWYFGYVGYNLYIGLVLRVHSGFRDRWLVSHCDDCGVCVYARHHHCDWLNTCVFIDNYSEFIMVLFTAAVLCLVLMLFILLALIANGSDRNSGSVLVAYEGTYATNLQSYMHALVWFHDVTLNNK